MEDSLITVKYSGAKAENGIMDARASAEALLGFDKMIRYAICNKEPKLKNVDFDLPVKVQKGSWEITIPEAIGNITLTALLVALAQQIAKEGLFEIGPIKDSKKRVCSIITEFSFILFFVFHRFCYNVVCLSSYFGLGRSSLAVYPSQYVD